MQEQRRATSGGMLGADLSLLIKRVRMRFARGANGRRGGGSIEAAVGL